MPRLSSSALGGLVLALMLGVAIRPSAAAEDPPPAHAEQGHGAAPAAAGGAPAAAEHGAAKEPNILEPQPSLAIWTVVVFLGVLFVLGKFAWKPLLQALEQREEHLEHVLLDTERARNEAERLLAEYRRQMAEAEERARALLEEARAHGRANAEEILAKARAEADAELQRARREIETARDQALNEIWTKTADLAVSIAGKVLGRSLGPDDHRRLVELALGELPASPNGHGSPVA
jgi:F-type H+-transporting ATPase subunit b